MSISDNSSPQKMSFYMDIALEQAQKALEEDEVPVGAVLVQNDTIIASAHNQTDRLQSNLAHAEMLVLQQAAQMRGRWSLLQDTTMFVTLEPCAMCAGAMVLSRIDRVVYALSDPKSGACGSVFSIANNTQLNHRIEVVSGICCEKSHLLLKDFFRAKRHRQRVLRFGYYW